MIHVWNIIWMWIAGMYLAQDEISSNPVKIRDESYLYVLTLLSFLAFEDSIEV